MKRAVFLSFLIFSLLLGLPGTAYAQSCGNPCNPGCDGGLICSSGVCVCSTGMDKVCTALGCLPTQHQELIIWVLARAISLSGGIAFLLMLFGAFTMLTSSGNPEGIKRGGEMIASALMGIIFLIFSLFLLKLIGVDIFHLPEFG